MECPGGAYRLQILERLCLAVYRALLEPLLGFDVVLIDEGPQARRALVDASLAWQERELTEQHRLGACKGVGVCC